MKNKVVLIGAGNVGSSYAYALLNQRSLVEELVIIDVNNDKALGEVMDLNHSLAFAPSKIKIKVGNYKDVLDAKIVCISAGINQKVGERRTNLLETNKKIVIDIVENVTKNKFQGIFLIATNPLDIITKTVYDYLKKIDINVKANRVIGSGTSLDTSRLRYLIGERLEINPKNVHAYIIGEHGDSEFVPWSNATIGNVSIKNYLTEEELDNIYINVRDAAYKIIEKKGFTNFGIGICLVKITNAILGDENSVITVSCYNKEHNLFISQPAIINKDGVKDIINLELTENEKKLFLNSIATIKNNSSKE